MISKIHELKRTTNLQDVKSLCETTIAAISSAIYNAVTPEARFEIERVALENLFEGLSKHPKNKLITKWLTNEQRLYSIKNIGVREIINSLKETEAKNDPTLAQILERFETQINQYPEVLIYEEFISALSGEYNWVPGVTTQLDALKQRIGQYKCDIDITKIIEVMKVTKSNYLLPLIEDVVNNYITNKTDQTKSHLKETLVKFSYDPFIRDIINIVMLDAKDLQLEYASGDANIEKIYSPLMYLGENEVLFNIKGTFYVKKGNNINKLKKEEVALLNKDYRALCEAINIPNVEIDKKKIKVYIGDDKALITENSVTINDRKMNNKEFKDATEISQWVGNTHFYMLTETLKNNFNDIVEVDFAKRIYLKENEGHAADVIRLRNNIFITTYDVTNNKSTFYRNINPIQADKIMMEHMRFDVSKTFADILPNKEKIISQINETKKEFITYIANLNEKIEAFKLQDSLEGTKEVTKEVLDVLEEELKEVKTEYKDYVNEMEKTTDIAENVTVSIDVDGEKYTVPIPQKTSTAKGEETDQTTGTIVGAEHMEDSPASQITFQDDQTELLGDSPSIQDDQIDLGVDNVEASADAAEAGADDEEGTEGDEGTEDIEDIESVEGEENIKGEENLGLDDEEGKEDLGLGDEDEEKIEDEDEEKIEDDEEEDKYSERKDISEEGPEESEESEEAIIQPEVPEEAPDELEKGELDVADEVEVENVDVKERPANAPRVFLKKKVSESKNVKKKFKKLNENAQIGDTVMFDRNKGYVIGQTNDGDLLVQVQGSSHKVSPSKVKAVGKKPVETTKPPYKFDKKTLQNLTTKSLFEQYVKCGIYMGNTPIKLNDCFVKFKEWNDSADDQPVSILVEGSISILPKKQIRILENINDFANPDNYVEGVIIDESTGEALQNVMINVKDYTEVVGDADEVRIIQEIDGEFINSSAPAAILKTLSV